MTIESAFNDEDGYTVECKFKEPGFFGKTLTLRNATNSELEVLIVYKVKEFNKESNQDKLRLSLRQGPRVKTA